MPGLVEPALRRPLRLPARVLEGGEGGLGILGAQQEVDVVLGLGPASCPRGEPAAQHERDPVLLQDARTRFHRLDQLVEGRFRHGPAVSVSTFGATSTA